ncbi:RICIN domain-containing protein [Streptomyces sp. NPDC002793]|uniref:RICIN domain-containing protein n=1 Tax=Streptomyces sp. NPDC002793 TaxID=3154432 RepID=UPI0033206194
MAREEGSAQPAVRRATALPQVSGTAADPALTPRTPVAGRAAGAPPEGVTAGHTETVGGAVATPAPDPVAQPAVATTGATASASAADREGETIAAAAAGGMTGPPSATAAAGEPPSPRPNKPLLAAAAIGGSLLIAVPLLFMGTSDDETRTRPTAATVSSDVLPLDKGQSGRPPGRYVPASPSATPSPEATTKAPAAPPPAERVAVDAGRATASSTPERTEAKTVKKPSPSKAAPRSAPVRAGGALPTSAQFSTATGVLIKNRVTGLCVDVPDYGKGKVNGSVEQFTCNGTSGDNQLWDLVVNQEGAGPGGADLFTIRNSKDNYCADLPDFGGKPVHTRVYEYYCRPGSGDNQMWFLDKRANGTFWIRNHASKGLCLDVAGENGAGGRGAGLMLFTCSDGDDHLWSFA